MKVEIQVTKEVDIRFVKLKAGARYWEDSSINGIEDVDGDLIPFRVNEYWCPIIDIDSGKVEMWPEDKRADIHYKVCDDGKYHFLDENKQVIHTYEGYVPSFLSPNENGFGDYMIMTIDESGEISNWKPDIVEYMNKSNDRS